MSRWTAGILAVGGALAAAVAAAAVVNAVQDAEDHELAAAMDIGSGSMKLVVAKCHKRTHAIKKILQSEFVEVLLAHDLKQSTDGCLSEAVLVQATAVLRHLLRICQRHNVPATNIRAVATQVFRISKNGATFLAQVEADLGLRVNIVSQEDEARLGFFTGLALAPLRDTTINLHNLVVWDSGGASFQLTCCPRPGPAIVSYNGPLGSSVVTAHLVERIQGRSFRETQSPNPCSREDLTRLRGFILETLTDPSEALISAVARTGGLVVGIGEALSIFNIAHLAVGSMEFTSEEVWSAVLRLVGHTDEQLSGFPQPTMVLPKLVLLYTVMVHVSARRVRYCESTGVCAGLLVSF